MAKKEKYYKRSDGLFETIKTINGKRVAFRGKTCREVDQKMLAYQDKEEYGRTVEEVAEEWLRAKEGRVSEATMSTYDYGAQEIVKELGSQRIKQIKPIQCQRILERMVAKGYKHGSVSIIKSVLQQLFRYAVIQGDIDISPAAEISLPRGIDRKKRNASTAEQIKAVTECREGDWWLLGLAFLWTGCRRGELMALRYEDIDRKAKTITINKKYSYVRGVTTLEDHTKTEAGMRTIPLFSSLADALPKNKIGLVFHNADGSHLSSNQIAKAWNDYKETVGLPKEVTPHYFRHTFATICYEAGVGAKETAAILGHSNESITMELYTHLTRERKGQAAERIEEYASKSIVAFATV